MKGRRILIEPRKGGGHAAALQVDGRLEDLLVDPPADDPEPHPEAIYLARVGRPTKRLGGAMVDLGDGQSGFLRGPRQPAQGARLLVQVTAAVEGGKAAPVTTRLVLRRRTALLTPGAPGRNLARTLREPGRRAALEALASRAMTSAQETLGLILRSAAESAADDDIAADIADLRVEWEALRTFGQAEDPGLRRAAPGAMEVARREWLDARTDWQPSQHALAEAGIWEEVAALRQPDVALAPGSMSVEPTRALVAIDVNTGSDLSHAAALKANLAAAREVPRQLRLRGLGGQVVIDFAPLAKADRRRVETALAAALRSDGIETAILGWTPLGHLELRRKRARRPLQT